MGRRIYPIHRLALIIFILALIYPACPVESAPAVSATASIPNWPPVLNPIGDQAIAEGRELIITLSATDTGGDQLTFSASGMPPGSTLEPGANASQSIFRWMPGYNTVTAGSAVNFLVTFIVTDLRGARDSEQITITVMNIHEPASLDPDIRVVQPENMPPGTIDFGSVKVGRSVDKVFQVYNDGVGLLKIISIKPSDRQFAMVAYSATDGQFVAVTYSEILNRLVVTKYAQNDPEYATLQYSQTEGRFIVITNSETDPRFATVENPVSIDQFVNLQYSQTNPQIATMVYPNVASGKRILLRARYSPASEDPKTAELPIASNDPDEPNVSMIVQGTGTQTPDIRLSPTTINFGEVEVGELLSKLLNIHNDGDTLLTIHDIISNDPQFTVSSFSNVDPFSEIAVIVRFKPSSTGVKTAKVTVVSDDPDEPTISASLEGKGVLTVFPDIRVSPTSIDFGDVHIGSTEDKEFRIYNDGNATLNVSGITSNNGLFTVLDDPSVPAGGVATVPLRFSPTSSGTKTGTITIASDDPDEPQKAVSVQGKGVDPPTPDIRVSPTSIDFGDAQVGSSEDKEFRIYNDGNAILNVSGISSDNNQFTILDDPNVPAGGVVTIPLRFSPTSSGIKNGTITIASDDPDEPEKTVSVQGEGLNPPTPDIRVSPTNMDFGDVEVGTSLDKEFRIYNDGSAVLQISSITSSSVHFTILNDPDVPAGGMAVIGVRFSPSSTGIKIVTIAINSNDPDEPTKSVYAQGKGIITLIPDIRVSPTSLDFGEVRIGNSRDKEFQIYNDGNTTLQISSITSSSNQFKVLDDPNVPAGGVINIPLQFKPLSVGVKSGTITINSNDPDEPKKTVTVQGKGLTNLIPDIRVVPMSLDFGDVQIGNSLDKNFKIYNDGNTTLQISGITSDNDQFTILNDPDVPAGGVIEITVRFSPDSVATEVGELTIVSDDPDEGTVVVAVEGVGVPAPDIYVSIYSLDFGQVEIGQSSERVFYIQNQGEALLQVYSITSSRDQFEILNKPNVLPGETEEVFVKFAPYSVGAVNGSINIKSNDPDEPSVLVWIYGEGLYPQIPITGGWQLIEQQNILANLTDVHFANEDDGWIAGYSGTIAHSSDGGLTWTPQSSSTGAALRGVCFTSSTRGWVVGHDGTILRTTNGGDTWTPQTSNTTLDLLAVEFTGYSSGCIVGEAGVILTTSNGSTWTPRNSGTQLNLNDVCFVSATRGWAVGSFGTVLRTVDGGLTWSPLNSGTTSALYGVDFVDDQEGWAVGANGRVLHTQNGGQTWSLQTNGVPYNTYMGVDFIDSLEGWAVGYSGMILYTSDGGASWDRAESETSNLLRAVHFNDSDNGWAVGSYGTILGYHIEDIPSPPEITTVNVQGSPAGLGGVINIILVGQALNLARFSISGVVTSTAMVEGPLGVYRGSYTVHAGVNVTNALVTVTLTNQYGTSSTDTSRTVTIDTSAIINWATVSPEVARTGDTVSVAMGGEPNGTATFSIAGVITGKAMTQSTITPGVYAGQYTVPQGVNVEDAVVTVNLTDQRGNTAAKEAGLITIDTTALITSVSVTGSPAGFGVPIVIILTAEAGGVAKFSIAGVVANMIMFENQPGIYTGSYAAPRGTYAEDADVTVKLTDAIGNIESLDAGEVTIDTICVIESVNVSGSPANAGDLISVVMSGDENGQASFSIAGIAGNVPMHEAAAQPGTYTGAYVVDDDDPSVTNAVLTVTLTDWLGNVDTDASWIVTIDTTPPAISSVAVSGNPAKPGEEIGVTVVTEPNVLASFSIVGVAENVSMQESANQPGTYTGTCTVADDANAAEAVLTVTLEDAVGNVQSDTSKKVAIRPAWDVNRDGLVDASDLAIIGTYFGAAASQENDADVNGDGHVDVLDVIAVCEHFGESTASASPGGQAGELDSQRLNILKKLYESIKDDRSVDVDITIARNLLAELIGIKAVEVAESRLMQNYPNPCNPETWIPYSIAEAGHVNISIYSPSGQLVRSLEMGYRNAGTYSDKDKAAHWDGMNEFGEKVASGIYFYVIKSGDFNAVRKMIVNR